MSALFSRALAVVESKALDAGAPNPRPVEALGWHRDLVARWPEMRAEWDSFRAAGGRLPRIEEVIDEGQGNDGPWRMGLLVRAGRPSSALTTRFPATVDAVLRCPGIWFAMWSVLEPGTELPEHRGPNPGVLRYHLGIDCGSASALSLGGTRHPYRDGEGILFDDTAPHAAWNVGAEPRVTLMLELLRPLPPATARLNHAVQRLITLDRRYRLAPGRASEWDLALNGPTP